MNPEKRHCDDYIDDPATPQALRDYLAMERLPAVEKYEAIDRGAKEPVLFATYKNQRVRVVMASRFGDVGITTHLKNERGYDMRVMLEDLTDFSEKP